MTKNIQLYKTKILLKYKVNNIYKGGKSILVRTKIIF